MATECRKSGCGKDTTTSVRFMDVGKDLDMRFPIALCDEHANEILQTFEESDVTGVKKWLGTPLASL